MASPRQVSEHEAHGEVERVLYEMRQTLRVTGLDVTVRTWAGFERFLVGMWEAMGPNTETRAFESAADEVRAQAVEAAERLGRPGVWDVVVLGESQRYHVRGALELYHYLNPKMLVFTSAVKLALQDEPVGALQPLGSAERIERGAPARMMAMEWVPEWPDDARLRHLFKDILETVGPPSLPGDFRGLALWPEYLEAAWERLKPRMKSEEWGSACDALLGTSRRLARRLPYEVALSRERLEVLHEDAEAIQRVTDQCEWRLPVLVLGMATLVGDVGDLERRLPFPAEARLVPDFVVAGELR
ncbi:halocarboxylic acid dehydrogenase DehI family protein [Archangium sp.]|uniref:halocarboxylic acid dehydrogenase DehI family protein n=1 Tax=Archangium sp. TaxID=1872627 RepID=UPI002D57A40A|nr:halocarboxylic acid dehydrogenase DehI family protein [Archangium sp.]HYO58646.1 halocarboxylic acid dehydrogenase DehI family protein [Archangium sp.]